LEPIVPIQELSLQVGALVRLRGWQETSAKSGHWKDSFSKKEYSSRQRLHRKQGNVKVVYTPGFFLNGKEWKRRLGRSTPSLGNKYAGNLQATLNGHTLKVKYDSANPISTVTLNVCSDDHGNTP